MRLKALYSDDIIRLSTGKQTEECYSVDGEPWVVIETPSDREYKPVALKILFVSGHMPLETNEGYCADTDTLAIGAGKNAATRVEENGDLVAYWALEDGYPDDLALVAVALRNASKHLALAIANHVNKPTPEKEIRLPASSG